MTTAPDPRERLRELAGRLNLPVDELIGDLSAAPASEASLAEQRTPPSFQLSEAAIHAAISDSFVAHELAATDRELLEHSDVVMIGGRRRLRLSDEARGAILQDATRDDRFREVLSHALATEAARSPGDTDEVEARSAYLRHYLSGTAPDLSSASPAELRGAVAALERLRRVPLGPSAPSFEETRPLLEYAELLEPLRITIGATGPWAAPPSADRFVGRRTELRILRSFVDEIDSESKLESVVRGGERVGQAIRRKFGDDKVQGVRCIVARGGLGKSALIAKFVLDHALRQSRRFPFAYLDFDRAGLQARDPHLLLLEVARQIGLQFPKAAPELEGLRQRIRASIGTVGLRPNSDSDPFEDFRALVKDRITLGERALLIVLDTVEIVQCDPLALKGMLAFLERLSRGGFSELRLVAAARAPVPELGSETRWRHKGVLLQLAPLAVREAREMVQRLGSSLLGSEWLAEWTDRLTGGRAAAAERREPLSLRVAVETLRDAAPTERDALSQKIAEFGEGAADSFVGRLYETRVVGHVAGGEEVRKLAWPGLVVRRVSVELIRDLLAPLLRIDPSHAPMLFEALASQVWIVARDGDCLRHQPDLRARTLPFMRRKPEFGDINRKAIEYFGSRSTGSPQDHAEWLYHRLLGNEAPMTVDQDWDDTLIPFLKDAQDDFARGFPAAVYLAARTADRLLPDDLILSMEPALALTHIARAGLYKGSLTDRTIDPLLVALPLLPVPERALSGAAAAARATLLVKTGRWWEVDEHVVEVEGAWQQQAATALAFRRARAFGPRGDRGDPGVLHVLLAYAGPGAADRTALGKLIQDMATCRLLGQQPLGDQLDDALARLLDRYGTSAVTMIEPSMVRTAMLFGHAACWRAARLWTHQITEELRAEQQRGVSARELLALAGDEQLESVVRSVLKEADLGWQDFLRATSEPDDHARFQDQRLARAVCDAVSRRCERGSAADLSALRTFAAARDEDWVTPMAYAAHRATKGAVPKGVAALYESHHPVTRGFFARNLWGQAPVSTDVLEVLRRADEASDLAGAARLFLAEGDPASAKDLEILLDWYSAWRTGVQSFLDRLAGSGLP